MKRSKRAQDLTTQYKVYWIHEASETDIHTEGYVGVTKQSLTSRFGKHMYDANVNERDKKVSVWLRNAKDITIDLIFEGNYTECMEREVELRPTINIGQNTYGGGTKGKATTDIPYTLPNTDYHKELQRAGLTKYYNKVRAIAKENNISFKDARAIYSSDNPDNIERRNDKTREIAKELGISFSQARRVFCERRDQEFNSHK